VAGSSVGALPAAPCDALESALDALVELAVQDGRKVIVGGHSMGGLLTVLYRAQNLPKAVVDVMSMMPKLPSIPAA
jgi:alpha-beta hydrolase superfamily lysophospholipase